jgi:glycosyltransferase involved in cell wall biosynthesis
LCQRIAFNLVYTQDPFGTALVGTWLRKRFGLPLIIGNHSNFINNALWIAERPLFFSFLNRLAKYTLPRADAWRVLNEIERDIYTEQLGLPAKRIYMLNTPIALDRFRTLVDRDICARLREKLGIPMKSPVLLWIGRPVRFKRLPILLKAFQILLERLPEARFVIIGKSALQQEPLDSLIKEQGLTQHVIWLKEGVAHSALPPYYQLANVYAHTSHYEGFGKVMVEAAASGLPIVAVDSAGTRRIVRDRQTGFLIPMDDVQTIAERVLWLFTHPEQAHVMGEKGRTYVLRRFDQQRDIANIIRMWQNVVAEHQKKSYKGGVC